MNLYKIGKVVSIGKTYIILESSYTGSIVYVARPKDFKKDWVGKVYIYEHKSEYAEAIYGFNTFKERILFEQLLGVSGVGPKTALNILRDGVDVPIGYIAQGDVQGLSTFPSLGAKTAGQIIFELQGKYKDEKVVKDGMLPTSKVSQSLKTLGFNKKQIKYAVDNLKPESNIETLVEKAIVLISNANFA